MNVEKAMYLSKNDIFGGIIRGWEIWRGRGIGELGAIELTVRRFGEEGFEALRKWVFASLRRKGVRRERVVRKRK